MPRLPTYTAEVSQYGVSGGRRASAADFFDTSVQRAAGKGAQFAAGAVNHAASLVSKSPVGVGKQQLGKAVRNAAEEYVQFQEKRDVVDQQVAYQKAWAKSVRKLDELEQQGELGIPEKMDEFVSEQAEELSSAATTRAGMDAARRNTATLSANIGISARTAEAKVRGAKTEQDVRDFVAASGDILEREPENVAQVIDDATVMIKNAGLPKPAERQLISDTHETLAVTAANQWVQSAPQEAKQMIEKGIYDPWITTETKQKLIDGAETAIRQEDRERRLRRAEEMQEAKIANQQTYASLLSDMYAVDSDGDGQADGTGRPLRSPTAILTEATRLASQVDPSTGLPLLQANQLAAVDRAAENAVQGQTPIDDPQVNAELATARMNNTLTPDLVAQYYDRMPPPQIRYWSEKAAEVSNTVNQAIQTSIRDTLVKAGFDAQGDMVNMMGQGTVINQMQTALEDKSNQLANEGKDPLGFLYQPTLVQEELRPFIDKLGNEIGRLEDTPNELRGGYNKGDLIPAPNVPNAYTVVTENIPAGQTPTPEQLQPIEVPENLNTEQRRAYIKEKTGVDVRERDSVTIQKRSESAWFDLREMAQQPGGILMSLPLTLGAEVGERIGDAVFGSGGTANEPDESDEDDNATGQ